MSRRISLRTLQTMFIGLIFLGTSIDGVYAQQDQQAHGYLQHHNAEQGWFVIDDQAVQVSPEIAAKYQAISRSLAADSVNKGIPVRYVYRIQDQVWHLLEIERLETLPATDNGTEDQ